MNILLQGCGAALRTDVPQIAQAFVQFVLGKIDIETFRAVLMEHAPDILGMADKMALACPAA